MMNSAPPSPPLASASTLPPRSATESRTIVKPRPVSWVVSPGSQMSLRLISLSSMPGPLSRTRISISSPSTSVVIKMRRWSETEDSRAVNALLSRFVKIDSTAAGVPCRNGSPSANLVSTSTSRPSRNGLNVTSWVRITSWRSTRPTRRRSRSIKVRVTDARTPTARDARFSRPTALPSVFA
jgi:hypothetical protein